MQTQAPVKVFFGLGWSRVSFAAVALGSTRSTFEFASLEGPRQAGAPCWLLGLKTGHQAGPTWECTTRLPYGRAKGQSCARGDGVSNRATPGETCLSVNRQRIGEKRFPSAQFVVVVISFCNAIHVSGWWFCSCCRGFFPSRSYSGVSRLLYSSFRFSCISI